MNVVEEHSRHMVVQALKTKSDAGNGLITVLNQLEAITNKRTKEVQADWGGEFQNTILGKELQQRGTTLKENVPRHSETNAIIERANRTILDMSRTSLIAVELPKGCGIGQVLT